ncbi:unnamed protein product [Chondrus crispus]|uniref:Uncharacterized protein n=1 Tax=Chondrus crispus TaxID=2769 RepID=R7QHU3_CHOCR|nr:unnamed protein product [Chondrus crispus]CDF37021.1 unnamed protein product [Chondrus crispus]|eukprot:XP_005716840.1 unnamed protein product [Chondrus crispus]
MDVALRVVVVHAVLKHKSDIIPALLLVKFKHPARLLDIFPSLKSLLNSPKVHRPFNLLHIPRHVLFVIQLEHWVEKLLAPRVLHKLLDQRVEERVRLSAAHRLLRHLTLPLARPQQVLLQHRVARVPVVHHFLLLGRTARRRRRRRRRRRCRRHLARLGSCAAG